MKTNLCLLIFFITVFFACTKQNVTPSATNIISSDNISEAKTRSALLTSHPWIYKGLYFHYINHSAKGDPQYLRGANGNIIDLDNTIFYFKTNGSFVEYEGSNSYPGIWSFTNNADTVLTMDYTYWKDVATIITFDKQHLNYTQPIGYHAKSYTELIPSVQ